MKVLIADDHPFILAGLESVLHTTDYQIVGMLGCGEAVLEELANLCPEILILDVCLPGPSGVDVLRDLRSRGDQRPVVLLTAALEDWQLLEALSLGAQGIVLKESAHTQLLECLDAVREGRRWIERSLLQRAIDLTMQGGRAPDPLTRLSVREKALVGLVAGGLRNREIASQLAITEGTVKVYLHMIYKKLGVSSRTQLAVQAKTIKHGSSGDASLLEAC